jgi:hypothetical protein
MAADVQYASIANAIKQGLKNIDKYFKKMSESDVYFICLQVSIDFSMTHA